MMKTTVELPDQLITEVKIIAAREHRKLGELMTDLLRAGLASHVKHSPAGEEKRRAAEQWLAEWTRLGAETLADAPPGPTATEILAADRNRLEQC
jgi:hypothetical protein